MELPKVDEYDITYSIKGWQKISYIDQNVTLLDGGIIENIVLKNIDRKKELDTHFLNEV